MLGLVNGLFLDAALCRLPGIIPTKSHDDEQWMSPMDTIALDILNRIPFGSEKHPHMTLAWSGSAEFDLAGGVSWIPLLNGLPKKNVVKRFPMELLYNKLNLFACGQNF